MKKLALPILAVLMLVIFSMSLTAQVDNETCLDCHSDPGLETERAGKTVSMFVDADILAGSMHTGLDCIDCHQDADVEDFPHEENLEKVYCGMCHDEVMTDFEESAHGLAQRRKALYAPTCAGCHGTHGIQSHTDVASPTYKMNIPYLCGGCHREGAPVARVYDIYEKNIIENYSQSIHGQGLFQKGLIVTATCTDCHQSHKVLPHTDPSSSISPNHIASTCMKCHSSIEKVHQQVIRGELWEEKPGAIPACTDCHRPHQARKESVALIVSDRDCMKCHEKPGLYKVVGTDSTSVTVHRDDLDRSEHNNIPCVKCHSDIDPRLHRPCEPAGLVDCSNCHAKISEEYQISDHGIAHRNRDPEAPYCTTCHGSHLVISHREESAPTFRSEIPALCGDCHREDGKDSLTRNIPQKAAFNDYSISVHGKSLSEKGLLPSAICTDCHNTHMILSHEDKASSVNENNLAATCAACHRGIFQQLVKSVHFSRDDKPKAKLPTCKDCHHSHTIEEVKQDQFMTEVTTQCGSCHEELGKTYLETMHGKAYQLGYLRSAKCSDCHGAHLILGVNDPASSVGFNNIVKTCQQCHEDAHRRFTGYLTHATHHDQAKYPILYYTYWAMTILLISVFGFFGLHTLLWMPRSFKLMLERKKQHQGKVSRYYIRRFNRVQRITHLFVITSFMSLAVTGMMLKFSSMAWANFIASLLGGVMVASVIHRTAAVVTFGYFIFHLVMLSVHKRKRRLSLSQLVFGKNSMMLNWNDAKEFFGTIKWFFGLGPRPQYGRWTYWEKFDYLAVFWGVAVIGLSGLMLWFPEFFTHFLPGWLINVATIIHSDEALLAVGFIFTIHFFNTHLRPEAFPMDPVIFTGIVPLEEYKQDRPKEYQELKDSGELKKRVLTTRLTQRWERAVYIFGYTFLAIGLMLVGLIIYSSLCGYQ
jgi:cytochrome b subunit of formate dehydrogenase